MARGTRRRRKPPVGKFHDLGSYFTKQPSVMESRADAPPPAKKPKRPTILPTPSVIPPSLPTPSPSPVSPSPLSFLPPPTSHPSATAPDTLPPSSTPLPPSPTSPFSPSLQDDLESLLLCRSIDTQMLSTHPATIPVQLFTRSQLCLSESYLDQLETMGPSPGRMDRLVDYLTSAAGPFRFPPGSLLSRLWTLASSDKVLSVVGPERILQVSCLFQSLLSLHPPSTSPLVHQQFSQLVHSLGRAGGDTGVFAGWLHIRQLLSPPLSKCSHHLLTFLVDLLLSDYWSHVRSSYSTGDPLFVSVFWSSSTATDFVSLPVRQLLDSICLSLHNYTDTEAEFLVLQSQLALLFLVMTRCSEVVNHLLQLSLKLTSQQFVLLIGSLHPTSLIMKLSQHRSLHSRGSSREAKPEAGSVAGLSSTSKVVDGLPVSSAVVLLSVVTSQLQKLQCGTSKAPVESPPANTGLQPPDNSTAVWSTANTGPFQPPTNTGPFQPPTNTTPIQSKANTTLVQSPGETNTTSVQSTTNAAPKAATPLVHPPANSTSLQPPVNAISLQPPANTTSVQPPANTTTSLQPTPTSASLDTPTVATPPAHLPNKFYAPTKRLTASSAPKKLPPGTTTSVPSPPPLTVSSPHPQSSTTLPRLNNTRGNCQPVRRSGRQPRVTKRLVDWRIMSTSKRARLQPCASAAAGGGGGGRTCENCDTGTVSCHRCKSRV